MSPCIVQNFMYAKYKKKPDFVTTGESIGFVMEAERGKRHYHTGDLLKFSITLFGDTIVYFNPLIQGIHMLGQVGLGERQVKYQIQTIKNRIGESLLEGGNIYCEKYQIELLQDYVEMRKKQLINPHKIIFQKPLTIKYRGEFIHKFDIKAIMNGVTRRIYMLNCYEGNDTEETKFYENLPQIVKQHVEDKQIEQHSFRKKQDMKMKGIIGTVEVDEIREEILDYLLAGEILHIGKNTRFGFGKYRIS